MFERRFGKALSTALLLLIALAVAAFCLNLVWVQALQPLIMLFNNMSAAELKKYARDTLFPTILALLVVYILSGFVAALVEKFLLRRRIDKEIRRLQKTAERHAELAFSDIQVRAFKLVHELKDELHLEAQQLGRDVLMEASSEFDGLVNKVNAKIEAAEEMAAQITGLLDRLEAEPEKAKEMLQDFLKAWAEVKRRSSTAPNEN